MKADCPVCKHTCEGDTSLSVALSLSQHMKSLPDDSRHMKELSKVVEQIDREVTFAVTTAQDDSATRKLLYDKCASLSTRLQTLHLYATSHLALAIQASRDMLLECGDKAGVSGSKGSAAALAKSARISTRSGEKIQVVKNRTGKKKDA